MKTEHTPGPWHVGSHHESEVFAEDCGRVANCSDAPSYRSEEEMRANSRLIAAAPEIFDFLKMLIDGVEGNVESPPEEELLKTAKLLVSKAGG